MKVAKDLFQGDSDLSFLKGQFISLKHRLYSSTYLLQIYDHKFECVATHRRNSVLDSLGLGFLSNVGMLMLFLYVFVGSIS